MGTGGSVLYSARKESGQSQDENQFFTASFIGSVIIRKYSISFLLLPFNIFSTYYFQSIMKPKVSLIVSVSRGLIISGILIMILPLISPNAIWYTMPLTEFIVMIYAGTEMKKYTNALPSVTVKLKEA